MDARRDARSSTSIARAFSNPGSPMARRLAATVKQSNSPAANPMEGDISAITPSSTSRQLFTTDRAPETNHAAQIDQAAAQLTILKEINHKKDQIAAAAAATAQELCMLEATAMASGINLSPAQEPVQVYHPLAAEPQPNSTAQEPALFNPTPAGVQAAPAGVQPAPAGVQPAPAGVQPTPAGVQPAPAVCSTSASR